MATLTTQTLKSGLLRVAEEPWPFPPHYPLAPQPLAALDLLDYPDQLARRTGREVLNSLGETRPVVLARRSAKARALTGPPVGKLLEPRSGREPRPRVEGDPKTDTCARRWAWRCSGMGMSCGW
jgi:hypothetical protein